LSQEYPAATFRLGGPAITPYTLTYGQVDWAKQFTKDVAASGLRLDFFSFHSYGDQEALPGAKAFGPYPPFAQRVKYYRTLLSNAGLAHVPLYVTEWGASADVGANDAEPINANEAGAAWSAQFLLAMAEQRIDDAMLLVLRDELAARGRGENWAWPAFLLSDGLTPKPLYNTALMFSKMAAQRIRVSGDDPTTRVIASVDDSRVTMIVVKSDWDFQSKTDRTQPERLTMAVHDLPFPPGNVRVSRYLIDNTHSNSYTLQLAHQPLDGARAGLTRVNVSTVPVVAGTVTLPAILIPRSSVTFIEISDIK
jgi:xylan 1,4-beta-xylosidase